jgi:hypothetical protein
MGYGNEMIPTQLPIVESKARMHQVVRSPRNANKLSCSVWPTTFTNSGHSIFDLRSMPRIHLIIFRSELKIAQRFNAGHYAFLFVESHRDDREFLSSLAGLDLHFITKSSVKTLGYCQACAIAAKENFPFMRWLLSFSTVLYLFKVLIRKQRVG